MSTALLSELVYSSDYQAIADDALKDEDNAAWVMELEPETRQAWIERIGWIRLADRLAESELLSSNHSEFQDFQQVWQQLMATGKVEAGINHQALFETIRDRWFQDPSAPLNQVSIQAWNRYLEALARYHHQELVFETIEEFETMLEELAASFFQVLPFLSIEHCHMAGQFGVVDQFHNVLRDLREDAEQGICTLPLELLDRFGLQREAFLNLSAPQHPGYRSFMQYCMYDYLPTLYRRAYPFILSPDLHPSWQMLRDWCLNRYWRIERILRRCDYDYVNFPGMYWSEVRKDLRLLLPERKARSSPLTAITPAQPTLNESKLNESKLNESKLNEQQLPVSYLSRTSKVFQLVKEAPEVRAFQDDRQSDCSPDSGEL